MSEKLGTEKDPIVVDDRLADPPPLRAMRSLRVNGYEIEEWEIDGTTTVTTVDGQRSRLDFDETMKFCMKLPWRRQD